MVLSRMRESADMTCYTAKLAERQLQEEKRAAAIAAKLPSNKPELEYPTEEELKTLPRVAGNVRWTAYTIAFVELCERFSYYGTAAVFTNFIQQPLPPNSTTGAGFSGQPGALGHGQRAATGLITFNTFWCYFTPIFGAWIADEFWGRLKTIQVSFIFAMLGHIILIVSALPPVIQHPDIAVVCFSAGLVVFGIGVGGFKSNIAPLIAEQHQRAKPYIRTNPKTGERCIVDPVQTISRIFMYFYLMINVGGLAGSISMIYAEKYIGFWLSFTIPTALFSLCPLVLFVCRHKYDVTPPTGSVIAKAFRLWAYALRPHWSWNPIRLIKNCRSPDFWGNAKPSKIRVCRRPYWMTFDDQWVDEVRRAVKACGVFAWYPVYWLAFGQMTSNLTSQAATMELHGVPNDIINNLDPLFLIITIPLMDQFIYPLISKLGFNFTPIKRIYAGYIIASLSMITATVTQHFIYVLSPCHNHASTCDKPAPISVWLQTITYILIAVSEIFTTITGYEYAYTKAPKNMKSVVQALYLMSNTVAAAAQQGLTVLSEDPLLKWNYGFVAVLAFFGGTFFYFTHRDLDDEEDYLNSLEPSTYLGREEKKKKKKGKKSKSKRRDRDLERGMQERPVERSSWSSF